MFDKIAILGAGAFGVALAKIAASQAAHVVLWGRDPTVSTYINNQHSHPIKLSNIILPTWVRASTDLGEALHEASVVILTVPMQALRSVLTQARCHIDQGLGFALWRASGTSINDSSRFNCAFLRKRGATLGPWQATLT